MSNTKTHYKKLQHPDYLGAYALEPNQELIATIKEVKNEIVTGSDGKKEECIVAFFSHPKDTKPMILNSTNCKTIAKVHGTPYIEDWQGKRIQLYATPVKAFGETVEALRIRPFVPETAKKPMSDESFAKALAAVRAGQYKADQIKSAYELTEEQILVLEADNA